MKKRLSRKFGHSALHISSGAGSIIVNDQGYPLFNDSLPEEYNDIARFDIKRLDKMCLANHIPLRNEWDILAVGYWTTDGEYEEPATDYAENGCMRHIWNGTVDEFEDAYEYQYGESLEDY